MTIEEIETFNRAWLQAWTDKDVPRLIGFYAEDCLYKDAQTAQGLQGRAALAGYLEGLFAATPPMTYAPDEVWPITSGFCGRWYCKLGQADIGGQLRGFDLVILRDREIVLNEVYVHQLPV